MTHPPHTTLTLRLDATLPAGQLTAIRTNLSGAVFDGRFLWLGGDEGTWVERVTRESPDAFGAHVRFDLATVLDLPGGSEEIDIEGLDVDEGYLWLIGSHSVKRKKPEPGKAMAENVARLARLSADGNRYTLARVPIGPDGTLATRVGTRTAARLQGDARGNLLTNALSTDPHLGWAVPRVHDEGPVQGVPSKDNGLDVEGLAVCGRHVFLGLRGPVLRGWAVVLEVRLADLTNGLMTLEPWESSSAVRRHFLELDGLGVRDLVRDGDDLLVLTGPTMNLDGPVFIHRWRNALQQTSDSLTFSTDLPRVAALPWGQGADHPEAFTLLGGEGLSALVCCDSPAPARVTGTQSHQVALDVFALDDRPTLGPA